MGELVAEGGSSPLHVPFPAARKWQEGTESPFYRGTEGGGSTPAVTGDRSSPVLLPPHGPRAVLKAEVGTVRPEATVP